jgi:hypothetical protein
MLVDNSIQFDGSKPIRETIRATGRTIVTGANTVCNAISVVNDVLIIARETIKESLIEARIDSMKAELNGMQEIAELQALLVLKRAELQGPAKEVA